MNTNAEKCGAKNRTKPGYCRAPLSTCTSHDDDERASARADASTRPVAAPGLSEPVRPGQRPPAPAPALAGDGAELRDRALEERDARRLAWWVAGEMAGGTLETQRGTVLSSVLRLLHTMGPEPADQEDALAEVELRGMLMHGLPPRDPEEWARAERTFNDEAMGEFRRWERLILARRAGIDTQPMVEAAEDAWAEATDKWREPATPP